MKKRLVKAAENTYYIDGYAKVGIYDMGGGKVCLMDAGAGMNAGAHIDSVLTDQGFVPEIIFITHNHIDHIAGIKYLKDKYGCRVLSVTGELFLYEHPELEPCLMYGGQPYPELDNMYGRDVITGVESIDFAEKPAGFETVNIDGHAKEQRGIRTPDDVWFLGDGLVSPKTLDEYHIAYIYDIKKHLMAIDRIEQLEGSLFVPSHSDAVAHVSELAKKNRDQILDILDRIIEICGKPVTTEEILAELFESYDMVVGHATYVVAMSTLKSYMTYLVNAGRVKYRIENYRFKWMLCEDGEREKNEL